jgi:hypothetical protein
MYLERLFRTNVRGAVMKKRYKIVNRRRFYFFITSVFAVISILLFTLLLNNKAHSSVYRVNYREIEVVEGDTLWNIALNYLPEKTDIRKMIYDIKEFNEMDNSYIYPGDMIKIPITNK